LCVVCLASVSNRIILNDKGEVLDLATGKVTDPDGNEYDAPTLTEEIICALAEDGIDEAERRANKRY
jgi:hypothetical protein